MRCLLSIRARVQSDILLGKLPDKVKIDGAEYTINTDFRTAIRFTMLMQDHSLDAIAKLSLALHMFFGDAPIANFQAAADAILWFYRCGKVGQKQDQQNKDRQSGGRPEKTYDFEADAGLIYAAFLQQYDIDLQQASLHWWQFKALFDGLTSNTVFMRVVGYRGLEITSDMSKEEQKHYRKLKQLYALSDDRTEEEKDRDFAASLARL